MKWVLFGPAFLHGSLKPQPLYFQVGLIRRGDQNFRYLFDRHGLVLQVTRQAVD
jgi:hypothetical protein